MSCSAGTCRSAITNCDRRTVVLIFQNGFTEIKIEHGQPSLFAPTFGASGTSRQPSCSAHTQEFQRTARQRPASGHFYRGMRLPLRQAARYSLYSPRAERDCRADDL